MHSPAPETPPAPRRRRLAGVLGALALVGGLVGLGSPAQAAEPAATGSIAGTVTGEADAPLEGVRVQLFHCDADFDPFQQPDCWNLLWGEGTDAITAADGTFAIAALEPGTYRAVVHPQAATAQYVSEYWDGSDSLQGATDITVTAGETAVIEPVLDVGATVTGRVVDAAGQPVSGGYVYAYLSDDLTSTRGGASVADDGSYSITGLPAGEYVLEAGPGWGSESELVDEYWQDAYDQAAATRVALAAGEQFAADFELREGGVIEGTVAGAGAPVAGVEVTATSADTSGRWVEPVTAVSAADGTYRLGGLEAGEYVVEFSDFDGVWAQQYWQGASDRAAATLLEVAPGEAVDGVDANLSAGGAISGTMTEATAEGSAPAAAAYFDVLRKNSAGDWERVTSDQADTAGGYEVSGLPAGEYTVLSYGSSSALWATTYYGGVYFKEEASTAAVAAEETTTGIDIETAPGVAVSGSVIDEDGGPATGVATQLLFEREPGVWVEPELFGGAGDEISYRLGGLPPGDYIVKFHDTTDAAVPYVTQYWQNAATQDAATVLEAPDGGRFEGINAVMTRAEPEPQPEPAPTPEVDGVAQVGQALTVSAGAWGDAELAYQWLADGSPIDGATGATIVPGDELAGATLTVTVTVTGVRDGAEPAAATSEPTAAVLPRFADVTTGGHSDNVRWAGAAGVIDGVRGEDGIVRFDSKATATRAEAAITLYRLAGSPAFAAPAAPTFTDVPADHEAFTAVEYLASAGVAFGYGNGTFGPDDTLKRQHLAAFLYRAAAASFTAPGTATFSDVPVGSPYSTAIEWVAAERLTTVTGSFRPTATTSREELATFLARWNALQG